MALISTRDLTKRYPGVVALDSLNLDVEPGIIGLVGANGAGKSTFLKILLGLIDATSGTAEMLGYNVATEGPVARQFVGYMPEHDCLPIDISATEFVAHMAQINGLPKGAARERTAETLRHVGLFEERYREMRGYSTGMKQRVKLAQALVHDPRLMLLDEPTNGLDPEGRDEMLDLVRRTGREFGISIIMASHLLSEIERVCEQLVVIDAGKLVQSDSIASFTQRTATLTVEVDGDAGALASRLNDAGYSVTANGRELRANLENDALFDAIRDGAVDLSLGLVRIEQGRRQLEDLFKDSAETVEAAGV